MEGSVLTPWGRSDQLRDRRLRPGPGKERADVERNHRERLYGATVAVVAESGYEGMSVGAIATRAGVSRGALYEYFNGSRECFLATFEALLDDGLRRMRRAYADGDGPPAARLELALNALFAVLVAQPAAGRLCFLESYAAGAAAAPLRDRGIADLEDLVIETFEASPERSGMPREIVVALAGGVRTVTQARLRRRQEDELPQLSHELTEWLASYRTPDQPLPAVNARVSPGPRFKAIGHRDRLFVALAQAVYEKGYTDTTVSDIAGAAGVSLSTFYEHFDGKEEAFLATCDFGIEQAFTAVRYAWDQAEPHGWPEQVRAGMRELLAFMASEPKWAYTAMVAIFAAGPRARARRDRTIELFTTLVEPGRALKPAVSPVVIEALGGAIYSLMYQCIYAGRTERLPALLPTSVFVLLAPFVGSGAAARTVTPASRPR